MCFEPGPPLAANYLSDQEHGHALATAKTHQEIDYKSLTDPEVELLQQARDVELGRFEKYKVYTRVPINKLPPNVLVLPTRWVESRKLKSSGERVFKSRLVAQGHLDTRLDLTTTTGACPQDSIRLNYLAAMSSPTYDPANILVCDVTCAFLQSELVSASKRPVAIQPPLGHPDRGEVVWLCKKAVYGLPDGSHCFEVFLAGILQKLGYTRVVDGI